MSDPTTTNDIDPMDHGYGVDVELLINNYEDILALEGYSKDDIKCEQERVSLICYNLGYKSVGLTELHKLLDLPSLFSLASKEPSIENSLQLFSSSYRDENKYLVVCESELELLKSEYVGMARFTAAAWMNLSYSTHLSDGIALGWFTLDMLFQSRGMTATHPENWTLDTFSA